MDAFPLVGGESFYPLKLERWGKAERWEHFKLLGW